MGKGAGGGGGHFNALFQALLHSRPRSRHGSGSSRQGIRSVLQEGRPPIRCNGADHLRSVASDTIAAASHHSHHGTLLAVAPLGDSAGEASRYVRGPMGSVRCQHGGRSPWISVQDRQPARCNPGCRTGQQSAPLSTHLCQHHRLGHHQRLRQAQAG